jgi:predicted transcriptional regulator
MNVLLSIKPKHVEAIIKGQKKYEFRRVIFKDKNINIVYVYASYPIKKIIGTFHIGNIIKDKPKNLWQRFNDVSGLDEAEFFEYFKDSETGFAIEIRNAEMYETPIDLEEAIPGFVPPQSFRYVKYPLNLKENNGYQENKKLLDY